MAIGTVVVAAAAVVQGVAAVVIVGLTKRLVDTTQNYTDATRDLAEKTAEMASATRDLAAHAATQTELSRRTAEATATAASETAHQRRLDHLDEYRAFADLLENRAKDLLGAGGYARNALLDRLRRVLSACEQLAERTPQPVQGFIAERTPQPVQGFIEDAGAFANAVVAFTAGNHFTDEEVQVAARLLGSEIRRAMIVVLRGDAIEAWPLPTDAEEIRGLVAERTKADLA